jgi:hypothetical protein
MRITRMGRATCRNGEAENLGGTIEVVGEGPVPSRGANADMAVVAIAIFLCPLQTSGDGSTPRPLVL